MTQTSDITLEKEPAKREEAQTPSSEQPPHNASKAPQWLPEFARNIWDGTSRQMSRMRHKSIEVAPAFFVNNSSNILGASHVATEMLMFKSGMKGASLIDHPENPINWVKEPFQKIKADIVTNSKSRDYSLRQLFSGNPIKNFKHYVMDTHDASLREVERQIAANRELVAKGMAPKKLSLGNPWQTRTTLTGLIIWSLSAVLPERKESDEEIERMAKMRTLHPIQYIGERLKQAVWVPGWLTHKREMLGLGYLTIGVLSGLGSWRNRRDFSKGMLAKDAELVSKGLKDSYAFNGAYFFTSVVSFIAGLPLLFALDERKAYSTYGSLSVLRIPLLPSSIYSKYAKGEPGWQSYTIGKLTFQVEDFLFSLIGGATKRKKPDGTYEIIDHEKLKKEAIAEAKEEKARIKEEKQVNPKPRVVDMSLEPTVPANVVSSATNLERAMPERVEQQARGEAANDGTMVVAANGR